jgi:hypothetical protein
MVRTTSSVLAARRVVLGLAALTFAAIAVGSLVAPRQMAQPFDYVLDTTNALSEFRAIYVGLWLAHVFVLAWAALRIDLAYLGDVAGVLVLGQVAGRLVGIAIDGLPDLRLAPPAVAELVAGSLILLLRPRKPPGVAHPSGRAA